jgi:hypothetical protein
VGREEDFEDTIKHLVKADSVKIADHDWFRICGHTIDVKHKIASSAMPYGRHTALARARQWNINWNAERERQPKADILIRAHVHYFVFCGGPDWIGIIVPALTYNSSFGARSCEGLVDVGFVVFDFYPDGRFTWQPILADFAALRVRPESL